MPQTQTGFALQSRSLGRCWHLHIAIYPRRKKKSDSGFPEYRISGIPDFQNFVNPEIRISGIPEFRISGSPDFRKSGLPEIRNSRIPEVRTFGFSKIRNSGIPDFRKSGLPDFRISGFLALPIRLTHQPIPDKNIQKAIPKPFPAPGRDFFLFYPKLFFMFFQPLALAHRHRSQSLDLLGLRALAHRTR